MRSTVGGHGNLLAVSDLHVGYEENRAIVESLRPETDDDWLLVAGDVGEPWPTSMGPRPSPDGSARSCGRRATTNCGPLRTTRSRAAWPATRPWSGSAAELGVTTPEDPTRCGRGGRARGDRAALPPLRLQLARRPGAAPPRRRSPAPRTGVVAPTSSLLHPDPYPPRGLVPRPRRRDRARLSPPRRPAHRPRQPLPAGARAHRGAALPGVRPVVRHRAHRRLARRYRAAAVSTATCTSRASFIGRRPLLRGRPSATRASGAPRRARRTRAASCRWRPRPVIEYLLPAPVVTAEPTVTSSTGAPCTPRRSRRRPLCRKRRASSPPFGVCPRGPGALGLPPQPVLPGEERSTRWPDGLVGSMTHCEGYRAAAVARVTILARSASTPSPTGRCPEASWTSSLPDEERPAARPHRAAPAVHWDRLLFSAKETVYKAWFPLTGLPLRLRRGGHRRVHGSADTPRQEACVPGSSCPGRWSTAVATGHFDGRWTVRRGLVATAVTVPARAGLSAPSDGGRRRAGPAATAAERRLVRPSRAPPSKG